MNSRRLRRAIAHRFGKSQDLHPRSSCALALMCISVAVLCTGFPGCKSPEQSPVTVTLLDPGWPDKEFIDWRARKIEEFTRETRIRVRLLPAPETAIDQLVLWRKLLGDNSEIAPDVFTIDVIWPTLMADYALDLAPYAAQDTADDFPILVANNTVKGHLVALPYRIDAGVLFYRTDLLHDYGYREPPSTWGDLEVMAARIQRGERTKGKENFWGFVWQGAPAEGLTCNALEWQASEGGGRILEEDGTITINNPSTIRAWERAARWVGTISPPGVIAYREWDGLNLWRQGNVAFMRNWPASYVISRSAGSAVQGRFAIAQLPAGSQGSAATMGGASLSISRRSAHPKEALALVRYLCQRDVQLQRSKATSELPTFAGLYEDPGVLAANPHFRVLQQLFRKGLVVRPSTVTGTKYPDVSRAYFTAVHSVLARQVTAKDAAADLEKQLAQITGYKPSTNAHK